MGTCSNKRIKQALMISAGLTLGSVAAAQSTSPGVSLFGLVDISMATSSGNGYRKTGLLEGTSYGPGSRWGLRVNEDLGSGLAVGALLESGFSAVTGESLQGARLFGRQAYLWLRSDRYGELRMGRQYVMHEQTMASFNPTTNSTVINPEVSFNYTATAVVRPMLTTARADNALQLFSPKFFGLQAQFMYAFRGGYNTRDIHRGYRLTYTGGPLYLVASYDEAVAPAHQIDGKSSINKVTSFGGSYDFGMVKLFAGYQGVKNLRHDAGTLGSHQLPGLTAGNPARKLRAFSVGASIPVDSVTYAVNFSHGRYENIIGQKATIGNYGAAATYHLSKRSEVYGAFALTGGNLKDDVYRKYIVQVGLRQRF